MMGIVVYNEFFFFKQKTAYEMCGRDWSSDVCSSDLKERSVRGTACFQSELTMHTIGETGHR